LLLHALMHSHAHHRTTLLAVQLHARLLHFVAAIGEALVGA
jgi:hypothetical protein